MATCFKDISTKTITADTFYIDGSTLTLASEDQTNQYSLLKIATTRTDGVPDIDFSKNGVIQGNVYVSSANDFVVNSTDNNTKIGTGSGSVNIGNLSGVGKLNISGNVSISGGGIIYDTGSSVYKTYSNKNIGTVSGGNLTYSLPSSINNTTVVNIQCFAYNAVNQVQIMSGITVIVTNNSLSISGASSFNTNQVGVSITFTN